MKSTTPLLLAAVTLVTLVTSLMAQNAAPAKGRILLLTNERILEGDIERVGVQYRIRRSLGETWVPEDRVLRLCSDLNEAYTFLLKRMQKEDPDERLKLARWCHTQGLTTQALENLRAAATLRPTHAETKRLLTHLERDGNAKVGSTSPPPPPPATAQAPPPPADVSTPALNQFATRVQPILMNACAGCHTGDRGGNFRLTRAYDNSTASQRSVQQNLAAVLAQVNLAQPQASPFLTKSVTAHGSVAEAPLKGKQLVAYRTLEEWLERTLASNPHLREKSGGVETSPAPAKPAVKPEEITPTQFGSLRPQPQETEPTPAGSADPFDPSAFNRGVRPMPTPEKKP